MAWLRERLLSRGLALVCTVVISPGEGLLYGQPAAQSPPATPPAQEKLLNTQQLDSMVAPIALYPDPLLAQVLAASTYPLQIVTAYRWTQQHANLKGKELVEAAGKQDWDPSIQALVAFPSVLQMLDQNVEWTTALGNAFLAQQADVMSAVQRLRKRAEQSGKLESNAQQQVQTTTVEGQPTIVIQPADPQVIYVPTYEPAAVYGPAPAYYPYPPIAYPTGAAVAAGVVSFGLGVAVGSIFNSGWGWGWGCNWGPRPSLYVNNNFFVNNRNAFVNRGRWGDAYRGNGRVGWNHNPVNRNGVPYANRGVANRYNGGRGGMRPAQLPSNIGNIRPPGSQGGANRLPGNMGGGPGGRGNPSHRPSNPGAANRPGGRGGPSQLPAQRPGMTNRPGSAGAANRMAPGNQFGGSRFQSGNRGGGAHSFGNRGGGGFRGGGGGFRGGGGGFRGGGGARGGGRRR